MVPRMDGGWNATLLEGRKSIAWTKRRRMARFSKKSQTEINGRRAPRYVLICDRPRCAPGVVSRVERVPPRDESMAEQLVNHAKSRSDSLVALFMIRKRAVCLLPKTFATFPDCHDPF